MSMYPTKAPHQAGARDPLNVAPNAALLIDFDNVTMGMRSDLSKELKTLLSSDIIKGKVTVQRAYADWRRYPQYIVPLSEASIDLIFAPAYGSNKKNATDIRMAIDGIELVFIRPEIGTFILLTGDSDFSSLVLKLKEYGKYVIGVGIQESSSDILVQNCDEYYSYTSLSGLRKTTDSDRQAIDPWVLVERAVEQMSNDSDVMRSDRLKQVMVELDPGFDEGEYGFSKFSRFITEAAGKGLLHIRKLDNGQYEVAPGRKAAAGVPRKAEEPREERGRGRSDEGRRGRAREEERAPARSERAEPREPAAAAPVGATEPLHIAYDLLRRALERMAADGRDAVRDSDVKRKMLELDPAFDETNLGFSKFSRFLRQAHDHEVIDLHKQDAGNYEVTLRRAGTTPRPKVEQSALPAAEPTPAPTAPPARPAPAPAPPAPEPKESALAALGRRFGQLLGGAPRRPAEPPAAPPAVAPVVEESQPSGEAARPRRGGGARGRLDEDRSPETRADREERERQRRFHEAELAKEGVPSDSAAASAGAAPPERAERAGGERREPRGRGERGEGRSRRSGRGEGRGEGRGAGRGQREGGGEGEGRSSRSRGGRSRRGERAPRAEAERVEGVDVGAAAESADQPSFERPAPEPSTVEAPAFRESAPSEPVRSRAESEERPGYAWDEPAGGREEPTERASTPPDRWEPARSEPSPEAARSEPPRSEPARQEERRSEATRFEPEPSAETGGAPRDSESATTPAKAPGEFDDLEPSRLRGRTVRRGLRR